MASPVNVRASRDGAARAAPRRRGSSARSRRRAVSPVRSAATPATWRQEPSPWPQPPFLLARWRARGSRRDGRDVLGVHAVQQRALAREQRGGAAARTFRRPSGSTTRIRSEACWTTVCSVAAWAARLRRSCAKKASSAASGRITAGAARRLAGRERGGEPERHQQPVDAVHPCRFAHHLHAVAVAQPRERVVGDAHDGRRRRRAAAPHPATPRSAGASVNTSAGASAYAASAAPTGISTVVAPAGRRVHADRRRRARRRPAAGSATGGVSRSSGTSASIARVRERRPDREVHARQQRQQQRQPERVGIRGPGRRRPPRARPRRR